MSKAIKCDRCKKCFDPFTATGEFMRISDLVTCDGKAYSHHENLYRDEYIDLCPECCQSYNDWFAKGIFAKNTGPLTRKDGV